LEELIALDLLWKKQWVVSGDRAMFKNGYGSLNASNTVAEGIIAMHWV
jgi:hypothetical protein